MLKKIVLGLVAIIVVLGVVVTLQPASYHVERSLVVPGSPEVAYAVVNNLHQWSRWSPWEKLDPKMKKTLEGPESGVGSKYTWSGNDDVGEGNMLITAVTPNKKVQMDLNFLKPFESASKTDFTLEAADGGTKVTWGMDGQNDFMGKAFGLVMDFDKQVGGDFEEGLANLSKVVTSEAKRMETEAKAKADAEAAAKVAAEAAAANADAEIPN